MASKPSIFFIAGAPKAATSAFAAELIECVRDDITELSELTERNLDHWLREVW